MSEGQQAYACFHCVPVGAAGAVAVAIHGEELVVDGRMRPVITVCEPHAMAVAAMLRLLGHDAGSWVFGTVAGVDMRPLTEQEARMRDLRMMQRAEAMAARMRESGGADA